MKKLLTILSLTILSTPVAINFDCWIKNNLNNNHHSLNYLFNNEIVDSNQITNSSYSVADGINLYQGLVAKGGNTNGCVVVDTALANQKQMPAALTIQLNDNSLNLGQSYYVLGAVDTNNNFSATGTKIYLDSAKITNNQFTINSDGIYQLHLSNNQNSNDTYLELGQTNNNKITSSFRTTVFNNLAQQLKVNVSAATTQKDQELAFNWLEQYKSNIDSEFQTFYFSANAGFTFGIKDMGYPYILKFTPSISYTNSLPVPTNPISMQIIIPLINDYVTQIINNALSKYNSLSNKYNVNVNSSNVTNKSELLSYGIWINDYDNWFNKSSSVLVTPYINWLSRGFASKTEISDIFSGLKQVVATSKIFNRISWNNGMSNNNYEQFINFKNLNNTLKQLAINHANKWNQDYMSIINQAESGLNLHGYNISQLVSNNEIPQSKQQIDNYKNGESFHNWLQDQANSKYVTWQLGTGLEIAIPIAILLIFLTIFIYCYQTGKKLFLISKIKSLKSK